MSKNLAPKGVLIIVLVVVAAWTLYPPNKTLKPGIDLAGGTSLIYEIDTQGLSTAEERELSQRMITVLRKRIDPANIQNIVWRPQGNTRFEIQMPLASADTRQKRESYEAALDALLTKNISPAKIMRSLGKPAKERAEDFNDFTQGDPNRLSILENLAAAYDQRTELQGKRDSLGKKLADIEAKMASAGLDVEAVKQKRDEWSNLNPQRLDESLKKLPGADGSFELLKEYAGIYVERAKILNQLTDPESGHARYEQAKREIDKLNLSAEQVNSVLELSPKSLERARQIEHLKAQFADRAGLLDNLVVAYDQYRPFRGRLDDPKDLQRMLKGAGILEFRILPTVDRAELTADEIDNYRRSLLEKGPKYASDNKYIWCELENAREWKYPNTVVAPFGDKYYVLASNNPTETLLHGSSATPWKLERAEPSSDRMGRRAVSFLLNDKGGYLFSNVTGGNIGRPLCILLDGFAISAPTIQDRIGRQGIITGGSGGFTQTEVSDMVNKLNAGSLPARLVEQPLSVRTIGPSIGADNRDRGIRAGFIGLVAVMSCMAAYYIVGGAIADVALLMNLLFTLAIMALLRATFTLPGIAGTILTIGMSVDANVLIFERIREEQQKGASLRIAIKNGYERAFSAIFDSNITTIMCAAILYWVGSEDIKGFAIVLMLGLGSSLFTALVVTRTIFDFLMNKRILKDRLMMLHLIRVPKINWMGMLPIFLTLSAILTIGGVIIFFTRDEAKNSKYDIEFTGGTQVQINLKENVNLTRQNVEDRIRKAGADLGNPALAAASVYSIETSGNQQQYEITTTETNKTKAAITFAQGAQTVESVTAAIKKAINERGVQLGSLLVTAQGGNPGAFNVATSHLNTALVGEVLRSALPDANVSEPKVDEVVNNAVLSAFSDELAIQRNLVPKIVSREKIVEKDVESYPELGDFLGGIKIVCEIEPAVRATGDEIDRRFKDLVFKPDTQNLARYPYRILGEDLNPIREPNQPLKSFAYVSVNPEAGFRELTEDEWSQFVENETTKVLTAGRLETSLPRVTQIDPSVGHEAKTRALVAIVLSLIAMLIYIWVRFGNLRFGLGAVITLFHDTCVSVGMVTACTYIAATWIGQKLLISDFKIDLAMIAAFLTLLGYSINDSIVVYDRIRENRRKGSVLLTRQLINNSINETLSRTLLTGTTTLLVVAIMYVMGGKGLRGFNFAMLFGILEGTYSSIAISAPILLIGAKRLAEKTKK